MSNNCERCMHRDSCKVYGDQVQEEVKDLSREMDTSELIALRIVSTEGTEKDPKCEAAE